MHSFGYRILPEPASGLFKLKGRKAIGVGGPEKEDPSLCLKFAMTSRPKREKVFPDYFMQAKACGYRFSSPLLARREVRPLFSDYC